MKRLIYQAGISQDYKLIRTSERTTPNTRNHNLEPIMGELNPLYLLTREVKCSFRLENMNLYS